MWQIVTMAAFILLYTGGYAAAKDLHFKSFKITPKFKKILEGGPVIQSQKNALKQTTSNQSLVEKEVQSYLAPRYESIGKDQITDIFSYNRQFNMGQYNFSGFNWQKPMGYFSIKVNRSLAPDLFSSDKWIVTDLMELEIEAQTYLEKLVQEGMVEVSQSTLNAYAGIIFRRTYRYQHIAESFEAGLKSDLSKLFLGFLTLSPKHISKMGDYEFLERVDLLSFKAGASVGVPLNYGLEIRAGALLKFDRVSSVSVQSVGPDDDETSENERYRINSRLENITSTGVTASLQIDFFKLLKLHLISYELDHELTKSKSSHLSLSQNHLNSILASPEKKKELWQLMVLTGERINLLSEYVVSYEHRRRQNFSSKYSIFHFEGSLKKGNQIFQFYSDGGKVVKNFHRYTYSKDLVLQTFWGKLIDGVLTSILNFELFKSVKAAKYNRVFLEYNSNKEISIDSELTIDDESKLSIKFEKELLIKKYSWPLKKYLHRHAKNFTKTFTTLNSEVISSIENHTLHPPLRVKTAIRALKTAMIHFNGQSEDNIFKGLVKVCASKRSKRWENAAARKRALKAIGLNRRENCVRNLGRKYIAYKKVLKEKKRMNLRKLTKFMTALQEKISFLSDFETFFGMNNLFVDGVLQATVGENIPFTNYFRIGEFQGDGIIDKYVREQGLSSSKGRH
jgi:hypothetical protein